MHKLYPAVYATMRTRGLTQRRARLTSLPASLPRAATELIARRRPGHTLLFVVDEVGQFVARDVQKMLDLQAIVQQLGIEGFPTATGSS